MSIALFAHRQNQLPENGTLPGREELFQKLRDVEVEPRISLAAEGAFNEHGVEVHTLRSENQTSPIGHVALHEVDLVVNRIGRSIDHKKLPDTWTQNLPPMINENAMRSLAFRKHRVQDEVLGPLGLGIPTRLVHDREHIDAFTQSYPASEYIVKPTGGTDSKGVHRLPAAALARHFAESPDLYGNTIIQQAYDFTAPLPSFFRPYDAVSAEGFHGWSSAFDPKEIRLYGFHSPAGTDVFAVGRAIKDAVDNWFFLHPDSVPEKLHTDTENVMQRAAAVSGSLAVFGALDVAYGRLGNDDPDFHVVELNGKAPYMIGYDKHPDVADDLRTLFAKQIRQTIDNSHEVIG